MRLKAGALHPLDPYSLRLRVLVVIAIEKKFLPVCTAERILKE
jgi:hypothetical protein